MATSIFKRLMAAIGRDDLGAAPDLAHNAGRVARVAEIDGAIEAWTQARAVDAVLAALAAVRVPAGRVYTAKYIHEDPHYRACDMILRQPTRDGHEVDVPGIVPQAVGHAGRAAQPGTAVGWRHRRAAARDGVR